ncbi:MAG TPA: hypothetical protein PK646_06140 [Bacillota bacterium]|jgi:hypothetical protein|nr:hypothetical protein [Fastidiosipila sp.]HPX93823.1 hypothetical protein [Bacillota bacterium]HQB81648.1 hypothetical protein [Bacillota bacterium]
MTSPEQSIKMKDLIFVVLRAWRQIAVFALAGVVLLAGLAYYRSFTGGAVEAPGEEIVLSDKEIADITAASMGEDLEIAGYAEELDSLNKRLSSLSRRQEKSIYLTIDEKAQETISFEVVVEPEMPLPESDETYAQRKYFLGLDFLKLAKSDLFVNSIASKHSDGIEAVWLKELLSYELLDDNVLHLEIIGPDKETVRFIAEAARQFFTRDIREHLDVTYLFDVEIRNEKMKTGWNPEVKVERDRIKKELAEIRLAISEQEEAIDARLDQILEEALVSKIEKAEAEAGPPAPRPSRRKEMIKYGLAGAFIGILLAAFIAVFKATSQGLIWSPEDFADQVKLFYIGSVHESTSQENKKMGAGIDRLLTRLFYGRQRSEDPQRDLHYTASVLEGLTHDARLLLEAGDRYVLAVIGSGSQGPLDRLVQVLNGLDRLEAVSVEPDTAEGVKILSSAHGVVQLVEARGTRVRRAVHDLELSLSLGRKILGIVGLEII